MVQRVVLNPLPYPESNQLVRLEHGSARINVPSGIGMTAGLYYQYQRANRLDGIAIYRAGESTLLGGGEPERIRVARTTTTLASVLRTPPMFGRWFTEQEGTPGAPPVAVLSHGLWARRFGSDSGILGRSITLDGVPASVVGIMPVSFAFPDPLTEAWVPAPISRATGFGLPFGYVGVGRLRQGTTVSDARAELNALIADLPQAFPGDRGVLGNIGQGGLQSTAMMLKEATIGDISRALWILLAAVGLVLLVACANVANLFLVRSEARQREVAVRRALGAGASGIARFFLSESVLLSGAGGLIGLGFAWGAVRLLVTLAPATLPRLEEIRLDPATIAFTFTLSMVAALAFGSTPAVAWRTSRRLCVRVGARKHGQPWPPPDTSPADGRAGRDGACAALSRRGSWSAASRTCARLDPGFDRDSALTFRIGLPERVYPTRAAAARAHYAILDQLAAMPGVTAVSASTGIPLADACFGNTVLVQGRDLPGDTTPPIARLCAVSGEYVEAMRVRLLRGRGIDRDDVERNQPNVIVNQAFVDTVFPEQDPIGQRIRSNAPPPPPSTPRPEAQVARRGMAARRPG